MLATKVSSSGWPTSPITYQWRPPGGTFVSGAPGVRPTSLRLGVELVEQRVEVALVDAAAVEQDQRALGLARGLADEMHHLDDLARPIAGRLLRLRPAGW